MKTGLAAIDSVEDVSAFVEVMAKVVNTWQPSHNRQGEFITRHKFLRDLLAECDQKNRSEMYSALVPHLNFKALPLADYESMMRERVSALVSKGAMKVEGQAPKPIDVGGKKYAEAPASLATHALAKLHCWTCPKKKNFLAETPVAAMIDARKAGWQRMPTADGPKETCPGCVKKILASVKHHAN